jgi:hypothetical protein
MTLPHHATAGTLEEKRQARAKWWKDKVVPPFIILIAGSLIAIFPGASIIKNLFDPSGPTIGIAIHGSKIIHRANKCVELSGHGAQDPNWVLWTATRPNTTGARFAVQRFEGGWKGDEWSVSNLTVGPTTATKTTSLTVDVFYLPSSTSSVLEAVLPETDGSATKGLKLHTWITTKSLPEGAADIQSIEVIRLGGAVEDC